MLSPALLSKLAMKIGGEYRLRNIGLRHWHRLAADVHTDRDALIDRIRAMAAGFADLVATIQTQSCSRGVSSPHNIVAGAEIEVESQALSGWLRDESRQVGAPQIGESGSTPVRCWRASIAGHYRDEHPVLRLR
jgi:hypothetical protein